MAHISLTNNTDKDLHLTLPNGIQVVFNPGNTKTGSLPGHYVVYNPTDDNTLASIEFLHGTLFVTIDTVSRVVSILYLQVGCQPARLTICLCPYLSTLFTGIEMSRVEPGVVRGQLGFHLNPQSRPDGAGFYDAPYSPHLPSICTCILCAPFVVVCFELKHQQSQFFLPTENKHCV